MKQVPAKSKPAWAVRIRNARGERSQREFASLCNVSQVTISRWEKGEDEPTAENFARLAVFCEEPDRAYFWNLSRLHTLNPSFLSSGGKNEGLRESTIPDFLKNRGPIIEDSRQIPILRDSLVAGTPSACDPYFVTELLALPEHWFGEGGMLCAFQLEAASMDPVVPPGSIVVIDTEDKDPERLVDVIVAAREWNALKLFWLQKHKDTYKLVPERVSSENPVWDVQSSGDHSIVGRVIRWIASPPEKQPQASSVFSMFRRR